LLEAVWARKTDKRELGYFFKFPQSPSLFFHCYMLRQDSRVQRKLFWHKSVKTAVSLEKHQHWTFWLFA